MLGNLILGMIIIVVGTALAPVVANQVSNAQGGNITGASSTILGLTTLFYCLSIATSAMGIAIQGMKNMGF